MTTPAGAAPALDQTQISVLFINSFIKGTIHTLSVQCSYEVKAEKTRRYNPAEPIPVDICGVIGLTSSAFRGAITLCFPEKVFLDVMSKMFGETYTEITNELTDGAGELLNIIFGTAKSEIVNAGFSMEKAIPTVIKGQNIRLNTIVPGGSTILVPFVHGEDRLHILVGLGL